MQIIQTKQKALDDLRGRPPKYPFRKLKPGQSLVIDYSPSDLQRIKSAFYQFRKNNNIDWKSCIRVNDGQIFVNRLS